MSTNNQDDAVQPDANQPESSASLDADQNPAAVQNPVDPYRSPRPVGGHKVHWVSVAVLSVIVLGLTGSVIAYS